MFPINLLRDLTIESISTSHYLVIDVDIFLSERIYDRINSYGHWLQDERLILLLPLFGYRSNRTTSLNSKSLQSTPAPFLMNPAAFRCYEKDDCKEAWE